MKKLFRLNNLAQVISSACLSTAIFSVSSLALADVNKSGSLTQGSSRLAAAQQSQKETKTINDRYIVVLKSPSALKEILGTSSKASLKELFTQVIARLPIQKNQLIHGYQNTFLGFSAQMSSSQAKALQGHGLVQWVEQDQEIRVGQTAPSTPPTSGVQSGATWGLDRLDSRTLALDSRYAYNTAGQGVHAYVVDTGIRADHTEFTGRLGSGFDATQAAPGGGSGVPGVGLDPVLGILLGLVDSLLGGAPVDSPITIGLRANRGVPTPQSTEDCNGHGTHVAATIGGTRYGVAKAVTLHPVKTIGCDGTGSMSSLIAGIEWVINNHTKPAVMNMSLGGGASAAVDRAVQSAVNAGVVTVVAAGNENMNACNSSPAREDSAITVASTDRNDNRSSFSNFGTCVDLFAPGTQITSAGIRNPSDAVVLSGTSMASPHVAGHAAKMLSQGVAADLVPSQLLIQSTPDVVKNVSGSPNRMLFSN